MIPHVTDEIKRRTRLVADDMVYHCRSWWHGGRHRSQAFWAIRQLRMEVGRSRSLFIHLTLVPFLRKPED